MKGSNISLSDFPRQFIYDDAPTLYELQQRDPIVKQLFGVCKELKRQFKLIQLNDQLTINEAYYVAIMTVWGGQNMWNDRDVVDRLNILPDSARATDYLNVVYAMADGLIRLQPDYRDVPGQLPPLFDRAAQAFPQFREWAGRMASEGRRLKWNLRPMPCATAEVNLTEWRWLDLTNGFEYSSVKRIVNLWADASSQYIILRRISNAFERLKDQLDWTEKLVDSTRHNLSMLNKDLMTARLMMKPTDDYDYYRVQAMLNDMLDEFTGELNMRVEQLESEVSGLRAELAKRDETISELRRTKGKEWETCEQELYDKLVGRAQKAITMENEASRASVYRLIKDLIQGTFPERSVARGLESVLEQALVTESKPAVPTVVNNNVEHADNIYLNDRRLNIHQPDELVVSEDDESADDYSPILQSAYRASRVKKWVSDWFLPSVTKRYEWFALQRILQDYGVLNQSGWLTTKFADEMRAWFPERAEFIKEDEINRYKNGYLGLNLYSEWDENEFLKKSNKKQQLDGFKKLKEMCSRLNDHAGMLEKFKKLG